MLDTLLSLIAPHHCYHCQKTGEIICRDCKKYITRQRFTGCVRCGSRCRRAQHQGLPYSSIHCLLRRRGAVKVLIDAYKFQRARAVGEVLADLFHELAPALPDNTVIVPIPTAPRNVRRRGYDHMKRVARRFARQRHLPYSPLLVRRSNITQHFAKTAEERRAQAGSFFAVRGEIDPRVTYVLLDDIYTTGSTVEAAARMLREAGAETIWVIVLARQGTV